MILVDAGPLVALCDRRDGKHHTAVKHLAALAAEDFAVCDAVLTEACFHLSQASQRQRLRLLLHELGVRVLPVSDEREFAFDVFDWLATYADHEPDWADGCLAVLSGRDGSLKVWTYDREFRTTWRRPDGSEIPMAVKST